MSTKWSEYRLNEAGRLITGKTPKSGVIEFEGDDVPFVTPPDFNGEKWIKTTVRRISEAGAQSVQGSLIPEKSVLVSCIGSDMGKAGLTVSRCVTNQQINAVIVDQSRFCPEFLYYNLSLRKAEIQSIAGGSAQPILNKSAFGLMTFRAPSLVQQLSISATLRPLDDRITLLRETNQTLEAIAQALFKSWFVDFDPVRAKAEGQVPEGIDAATAALFPDAFEESELGMVPRGWSFRAVGELLIPKRGKSITKAKCVEGDIPVVAGGLEPAYFHNQSNVSSPVVTISASGANAGFVRLYQQDIWASDCSFVSAEQTDAIYFWYLFLKFNQEKIYFMQQGAAQPHIYPSDLIRLQICSSETDKLRCAFNSLVSPLFDRIGLNGTNIQTLSNLRDTLLPRLISGKLRIADVEAELEKATA